MLNVLLQTILPIFSIILLVYLLSRKQIIDAAYSKTANQIVFYVAIPAMILKEISSAPFTSNFNVTAVMCTLGAMGLIVLLGMVGMKWMKIPNGRKGTFLQSSFHGNIGYMSYAIAYFALGEGHFAKMVILGSFVMLGQNILAVWTLATFGQSGGEKKSGLIILKNILSNPIIVTVGIGMGCSGLGLTIPGPVQKGLDILGGMAFPTALLLIGAGLSFGSLGNMAREVAGIGLLKLVVLPSVGYLLMRWAAVPDSVLLPGIILLASPPATVTYVMATELGGKTVEAGVRQAGETAVSIQTMEEGAADTVQAAAQIKASTNEQVAGLNQVAQAMENIRSASDQIVASMRQAEESTSSLNDMGRKLRGLVERFRVT
ncbi:MAG: hypothetical protein HGB17_05440 [Syntrophobacteraceae bacterium]|nr:hypothetical protein [Syntrophobacteraceae bacterium]